MDRDEAISILKDAARNYADYLEEMDDSHKGEVAQIDEALVALGF